MNVQPQAGRRSRLACVLSAVALPATMLIPVVMAPPAQAAGEKVVINMPFDGKWAKANPTTAACGPASNQTSHPSCHEIWNSGSQWSVDLYGPPTTTSVRLNLGYVSGTVSFQHISTAPGTCGTDLVFKIKVDGNDVGQIYVTHIKNAVTTTAQISDGGELGKIESSCHVGYEHAHMEFKNLNGGNSCYRNYSTPTMSAGMSLASTDVIGVLGSANTGTRQVCDSIPSGSSSSFGTGVGGALFMGGDQLTNGQTMVGNRYIASQNGLYALVMQTDGNLVLYGLGFRALWSTQTPGSSGAFLGLQNDGNVVLYSSSQVPLWNTQTSGSLSRLVLQNDGNLVAYSTSDAVMWASYTVSQHNISQFASDCMFTGQTLNSGKYLRSADKRFFLLMQEDGNMVIYGPGYHVTKSWGTGVHPGAFLGLQGDGNMVVYSASLSPLWFSGVLPGLAKLCMQTDGNLVAYTATNQPLWSSGTVGMI